MVNIYIVCLCCFHYRIDDRACLRTILRIGEQPVTSPDGKGPDGILGPVVRKTKKNAGPDPLTGMLQMLRKCYKERLGNAIDEVIVWSNNS